MDVTTHGIWYKFDENRETYERAREVDRVGVLDTAASRADLDVAFGEVLVLSWLCSWMPSTGSFNLFAEKCRQGGGSEALPSISRFRRAIVAFWGRQAVIAPSAKLDANDDASRLTSLKAIIG